MAEGLLRRIGEGLGWVAPRAPAAPPAPAAPEQLDQITGPKFVEILKERVDLRREKKSGAFSAATDPAALPADRQRAQAKLDRLTLLESTPALKRFDELSKKVAELKKEQLTLKSTAPSPADVQKALSDLTTSRAALQHETTELQQWKSQLDRWTANEARESDLYDQLNPTSPPAAPLDPAEWQKLKAEYDTLVAARTSSVDPTGKQQHDEVAQRSQHVDQLQDDVREAQGRYTTVEDHQRRLQTVSQDLARFQRELTALSSTGFNAAAAPTPSTEAAAVAAPLSIVTPPLPSETDLEALLTTERGATGSIVHTIGGRDYHFDNDPTGRRITRFVDDAGIAQTMTVDELARREAQPVTEAVRQNLDRIQRAVDEKQVQRGGRAAGGIPASVAQQLIAEINTYR